MPARWSEERERALVRLWPSRKSTEIARIMGGFEDCTDGGRRAVNAKAARLGLVAKRDVSTCTAAHVPKLTERPIAWHDRRPLLTQPYRPGVDPKPAFLSQKHVSNG